MPEIIRHDNNCDLVLTFTICHRGFLTAVRQVSDLMTVSAANPSFSFYSCILNLNLYLRSKLFHMPLSSFRLFFVFGFACFVASCDKTSVNTHSNILLIIADDMGLDASPCYSEGIEKPDMPNLQALCDNGLVFQNFWTYPICSPTRASIITGRYGVRTGVLGVETDNTFLQLRRLPLSARRLGP